MNRKLSIFISFILIFTLLCGCQSKKNETTSGDGEKIKITWLGVPYNPNAASGTAVQKLLEEKFNVEIEPYFYAPGKYAEQKSMLLASGVVPDLIYEMDPADVYSDVDQGILAEVPYSLIKDYAPTIYKNINETAPEAWLYSTVNGANYGVPNLNYNNDRPRLGMWRVDWLENVGINKVPETLDEMYDAFTKFVNNDPDKNGKKDTYALTGDIKNWHMMFTDVFGSYGVLPFNWMEDNGKIVYGGLKQETVDVITILAKWYREGLIHPDFITDSMSTSYEKFLNGNVGFINQNGTYFDMKNPDSTPNVIAKLNPNAKVDIAIPVKGPKGKAGTHTWGLPCHTVSFGEQLSRDPEKLKRILEMFEYMVTDEEFLVKMKLGEKDVDYKYYDESIGATSGVEWLGNNIDSQQRKNACLDSDFGAPAFFVPITPSREIYEKNTDANIISLYSDVAQKATGLHDVFMKPDVLQSSSKYLENLRNNQIALMVKAIKGEITPKQYNEQFTDIWNKYGGTQLEKEAQQMQSNMQSIFKEVGVN